MSEESKKYKVPTVPHDVLITMEFSGAFLKRCQTLLLGLAESMGQEAVTKAFQKFRDTKEEPSDMHEAMLFTMTAIVGEMEKKAIEQKKVVVKEYTEEDAKKLFSEN